MEPRFTQELEAKDIERLAGNEVNVYLDPVGFKFITILYSRVEWKT